MEDETTSNDTPETYQEVQEQTQGTSAEGAPTESPSGIPEGVETGKGVVPDGKTPGAGVRPYTFKPENLYKNYGGKELKDGECECDLGKPGEPIDQPPPPEANLHAVRDTE